MVLLKTVISGQWSRVRKRMGTVPDLRTKRIEVVESGLSPFFRLTWLKPCFYLFLLFTIHCSLFTSPAQAEEKAYKINVEGMHCKVCVYRVTKSLKKLKQVKDVNVNLDEGTATVTLNDGEDVTQEALNEAIEDSGYKPNGITNETANRGARESAK